MVIWFVFDMFVFLILFELLWYKIGNDVFVVGMVIFCKKSGVYMIVDVLNNFNF